ncbi:YccS family putative transporter [Viridibacterium curvum]|uniref:YccS family putative transporter n=1 Tax=Viridibacterium curvum TaxID=1101404 RepID=A0ABP9QE64_9RHOO
MTPQTPRHAPIGWLRRLWAHDKTLDSLKVAIAFAGVVLPCLLLNRDDWLIGLVLGVIACALAETEDRVPGRLRALAVTLVCFAVAAFSVRLLFPWPLLFATGLALSTFGFVMLGAMGERYAAIAVASLILAVYCMLVAYARHVSHSTLQSIWFEPLLLLTGAAWFGLVSVMAAAMVSTRAVRRSLASLYLSLGRYLALKARLFEPVGGRDIEAQRRELAAQNSALVGQFNRTREVLIRWVQEGRPRARNERFLKWYFLAQDIHERASSSHQPYEQLAEAFARSDILYRCQHLMQSQARGCRALAEAILRNDPFARVGEARHALDALLASRDHVVASDNPTWQALRDALEDLCRNVTRIETQLALAGTPDALPLDADTNLRDNAPRSLAEKLERLRADFSPRSARFRHGIRLACALTIGYALLHVFDIPQGYWVLLTTVFVCQPSYSSTWRRMGQRVGGTVLGLVAAWAFIDLFPHPYAQSALAVAAGVAFFALRHDRYLLATSCITVLVFACFSQLGDSYVLLWPRLFDTLIGAVIAGGAVAVILPDWQGQRLHGVMADTIEKSRLYLAEILGQYASGKRDDLPYRIARREAHNADAELSRTIAGMLDEPDRHHVAPELAWEFLNASHSLLAYASALGAHRERIDNFALLRELQPLADALDKALAQLAHELQGERPPEPSAPLPASLTTAEPDREASPTERRLLRQLRLMASALVTLRDVSQRLAERRSQK